MPVEARSAVRVAGFGGLVTRPAPRAVAPNNAVDCLNTYTADGTLRVRPGVDVFGQNLPKRAHYIKPFFIGRDPYWYVRLDPTDGTNQSRDQIIHGNGSLSFATDFYVPQGTEPPFAQFAYGRLYVCYGFERNKKIYRAAGGAWRRYDAGIVAPAVRLGVLTVQPGLLPRGIYSYRYTYLNKEIGLESGPSPGLTLNVTVNEFNQVHLQSWTPSVDPQVGHIRIYRQYVGVDSTWYFVAEIPQAQATYIDNEPNISKVNAARVRMATTVPPRGELCLWHKRRMFWLDQDGTTVWASEFDAPEIVDVEHTYSFGGDDGERVVAWISAFGYLWAFKRNSIWVLTGDNFQSFSVKKVAEGVGCVARDTLVQAGPWIYFADSRGVMRFNGSQVGEPTTDIIPTWRQFLPDALDKASATYDYKRSLYILTGSFRTRERPFGTGGGNPGVFHNGQWRPAGPEGGPDGDPVGFSRQLVFDTRRGTWNLWGLNARFLSEYRSGPEYPPVPMAATDVPVSGQHWLSVLGGPEPDLDGTEERLTDWNSRGLATPIPWVWQMAELDLGSRRRKAWYHLTPVWERIGTTAQSMTVRVQAPTNTGAMRDTVLNLSGLGSIPIRIGRLTEGLIVTMGGESSDRIELVGVEFDAEIMGYR